MVLDWIPGYRSWDNLTTKLCLLAANCKEKEPTLDPTISTDKAIQVFMGQEKPCTLLCEP